MKLDENLTWGEIGALAGLVALMLKGLSYIGKRVFTFAVIVNGMDNLKSSFEEHKNETNMRLTKQDTILQEQNDKLDSHSRMLKKQEATSDAMLDLLTRVVRKEKE